MRTTTETKEQPKKKGAAPTHEIFLGKTQNPAFRRSLARTARHPWDVGVSERLTET